MRSIARYTEQANLSRGADSDAPMGTTKLALRQKKGVVLEGGRGEEEAAEARPNRAHSTRKQTGARLPSKCPA